MTSVSHPVRRRSRRLASAALAALVAIALWACDGTTSPSPPPASVSPSPAPSGSPSPPPSQPSTAQAADVCAAADLSVTGGPWGGAAGSRGADVAVENEGTTACRLPVGPSVAIVDATGVSLLDSGPPREGEGPMLGSNEGVTFSLVFSNWCAESTSLPLSFRLRLGQDAAEIEALSLSTVDELPPCNGPGQPPSLSTTPWQPA